MKTMIPTLPRHKRRARKKQHRQRHWRTLWTEHLEQRLLLTGNTANTIAVFEGSVPANDEFDFHVRTADFTAPRGVVTLGFLATTYDAGFDPGTVSIVDSGGNAVTPFFSSTDVCAPGTNCVPGIPDKSSIVVADCCGGVSCCVC